MDRAVARGVFAIAAAILSLILAMVGFWLSFLLHIPTPAELVFRSRYFSSPATGLFVIVAVDWVFWLALMWVLYWLFSRWKQKRGKPS